MELKFRCPTCARKLEVDASLSGTAQECPNCHIEVTIPNLALGRGLIVGGYEILKPIGRGAMGEVFLATQLSMGREVAFKVLHSQAVTRSDFVDRFLHEVRLAAQLEHPNIVTAIDAGEDTGVYWFAMAYVKGMTLDASLIQRGALPEKEALAIGTKIANALEYAWKSRQILHRDIKPANIMLGTDGEPMLMDMGIAKNVHEDSSMTATGMAMGTPHYMSPEQARGSRDLDFRADMYSLGATLYHLVVGDVPFVGGSAVEVVAKHLSDPLPPVRSRNPDVSESCALVIEKMMSKDRSQRFHDWGSCTAAMRRASKGGAGQIAKARLARAASDDFAQIHGGAQARVSAENIPAAQIVSSSSGSGRSLRRALGIAIGILMALVVLLLFLVLKRSVGTGQSAVPVNVPGTEPEAEVAREPSAGNAAFVAAEPLAPPVESSTLSVVPPSEEANVLAVTVGGAAAQSGSESPATEAAGADASGGAVGDDPGTEATDLLPRAPASAPALSVGSLKADGVGGVAAVTTAAAKEGTAAEDGVMLSMEIKTALDDEMDAIVEGVLPDPGKPEPVTAEGVKPGGAATTAPALSRVTVPGDVDEGTVTATQVAEIAKRPADTAPGVVSEAKVPVFLDEIAAELLHQSYASALGIWNGGRDALSAEMVPEQLDDLEALIRSVVFINQRILDAYRSEIGRTVTIQFRQKKRKFLVKSVTPKGVKGFEIHQHGGIGRTFTTRDLDPREKWRRLGSAKDTDLEIMRVMVLAEAKMYDVAVEKARTVGTPLGRALLREILKQNE